MKPSNNPRHILFGGTFVLANKLQVVGDKLVQGASTKQWFLLRNLMDLPKEPLPTITQIAQSMDSTRQNIAKMLELMEREGLVIIEKSHTDHRSRSVRITEAGLNYTKQTAENAQDFLDCLFKGIDSKKSDIASKVLLRMIQNLEKMQEEVL